MNFILLGGRIPETGGLECDSLLALCIARRGRPQRREGRVPPTVRPNPSKMGRGWGGGGGLAGTLNAWSTLRPSPLKLALKAAGSPTEYVQTGTIEYSRCVVDQIIGLKTLYTVKVFDWTE